MPGSGKSFLTVFFLQSVQKYGPLVFIFDLGGSYEALTLSFGGTSLNVGLKNPGFTINPFSLEPTHENLNFLYLFLRVLIEGGGRYELTTGDEKALYAALERVYKLPREIRTLTNFASILGPLEERLHRWTQAGQFGYLFDNAEDTLTFSRFQTFPGCGAATSAPAYANVVAVGSQPSIYFNGANITDTSTSSPTPVLVGQQIYLTIQLADGSDPGTVATSIDWTVPGVSIADFSVSSNASSAKVVPLTQTEQPTIVFFWVSTGGSATVPLTVKYSYCVDANKQSCASASATFNVSGPTNATTTAKPGPAELMSYTDGDYTGPSLLFGDNGANPGMTFTAQMNFPSTLPEEDQAAMFVQLVNSDNFKNLTHSGTTTSCTGPANAPALDSHYPMNNASKMVADDVPTAPLEDDDDLEFAESQRLFSAITYLMVPAPSTPCNSGLGVSCSVPVPLGSTTWQFNGNAINTLKIQSLPNNGAATTNNTSYILSSCSGCTSSSPAFVPNTNPTSPTFGYPTWSALSVICDPVASTE